MRVERVALSFWTVAGAAAAFSHLQLGRATSCKSCAQTAATPSPYVTNSYHVRHGSIIRMTSRKTAHQVWHLSRGIVFAGGSSVVYPRLPSVRHHSAPAAVASEESPACLPPDLTTPNMPGELPAGQGAETAQGHVATISTTSTTIATTVSTISTTVLVEDGAATEGQPPAEVAAEKPNPKDVGPVVAPYTPLDFKIPDKAFREARKAADGSLKSYWNYSLYRGPGGDGALDAKVKVHYCTSSRTTERVIKEYFSKEKVLGFDLEWMVNAYKESGPRRNVSLVQLASPTRIGLFHLAVYPQKDHLVSPALKRIMEDPEITKVGVSIKGDCTRMLQFLNVKARGQFELSHLYRLVKYSKSGEYKLINKKLVALATQVKDCLGLPMFKGSDVRTSDWSQPLNMSQIICKLFLGLPDALTG